MWYIHNSGIFLSHKSAQNWVICRGVDRLRDSYGVKSVRKRKTSILTHACVCVCVRCVCAEGVCVCVIHVVYTGQEERRRHRERTCGHRGESGRGVCVCVCVSSCFTAETNTTL